MNRTKLLDRSFVYKSIPFTITLEECALFVHGQGDEQAIRRRNINGNPVGMDYTPTGWVLCEGVEAAVRPDIIFRRIPDWPADIPMNIIRYALYEEPKRQSPSQWTTQTSAREVDAKSLALSALDALETATKG